MNDLIKERDERTKRRKKFKKRIDSEYNLAYKDDEKMMLSGNVMSLKAKTIRLLDEGAVVGDENVAFIIRKGTLEKYLNGENRFLPNLTDDFVGTVNLGHMDFATFPFIIGEWTKKDLSIVDIGDERVGLDVKVRLDNKSVFVQELKRQPYDIGISSEFYYSIDWQATEDIGIPVIDEVYIFAYGLVGECGNVNSSGLELKGDFDMKNNIKVNLEVEGLDEVMDNLQELSEEVEATEEVTEVTETEEVVEVEEEAEVEEDVPADMMLSAEATEEQEEVAEEEAEEPAESEEAQSEEAEAEEAESEETADEEADIEAVVELALSELRDEVEQLKAENKALKATNNRLQKKLADEKEKKANFIAKFAGMAEKVGVSEAKPKEESIDKSVTDYMYGDGIGE